MNSTIFVAIGLVGGILLGYLIASRIAAIRLRSNDALWRERVANRVADELRTRAGDLRRDAAARSGKVLSGNVLEKFTPLMRDFPFDPHDATWIGHPVDFVVFDGLSQDREKGGRIKQVVFLEVKSGSSRLSARQRGIREAVEAGKVGWMEFRIPT